MKKEVDMIYFIVNVFCSWGVDDLKKFNFFVWVIVFKEVVQVGYCSIEFGFWGYFFIDLVSLCVVLEQYQLLLVVGMIFDDLVSEVYFFILVVLIY